MPSCTEEASAVSLPSASGSAFSVSKNIALLPWQKDVWQYFRNLRKTSSQTFVEFAGEKGTTAEPTALKVFSPSIINTLSMNSFGPAKLGGGGHTNRKGLTVIFDHRPWKVTLRYQDLCPLACRVLLDTSLLVSCNRGPSTGTETSPAEPDKGQPPEPAGRGGEKIQRLVQAVCRGQAGP